MYKPRENKNSSFFYTDKDWKEDTQEKVFLSCPPAESVDSDDRVDEEDQCFDWKDWIRSPVD